MKIIVLGATGMIGSTVFKQLSLVKEWKVQGVVRDATVAVRKGGALYEGCLSGYDLASPDHIARLFRVSNPNVVINCVGLTKHVPQGNDKILTLTINALLPHRLSEICELVGARLIHVSTDCVFAGTRGNYLEKDQADAQDIYGKTKHLGESLGGNALTLRTSTIGHELGSRFGLLEWFLAQRECAGYRRAVFSGLPSVEFANVLRDHVIRRPDLIGLYHVGAAPIDKDSLLRLVAARYATGAIITASDKITIDRSLNVERFTAATGYVASPWPQLIERMHENHLQSCEQYVQ
jgi:dTDP-4-dehydrorhamnose reductase